MTLKTHSMQTVSTLRNVWTRFKVRQDTDMHWLSLDSKMLAAVAYDAEKRILNLRFRTGDVYRYFDFPAAEYRQFLQAESRGRYFLGSIRNCFAYERMAKLIIA